MRIRGLVVIGLLLAHGRAVAAPPRPAAPPPPSPVRAVSAVAPPGPGQPALAVGFDGAKVLRAAVCPQPTCSVDGGQELSLPQPARALASGARLSVVGIGAGRRAVVVAIPDVRRNLEWKAVIVAPLGGTKPEVVFEGWTGLVEGQEGERRGPVVLISEPEEGTGRRLVIGELREELSLCGRPAVLAPRMLSPDDLKLHPAKVQRLTPAERESAALVAARRMPDSAPSTAVPLLRAVAASSAVGGPAALTDGNPETTWAENRGGSGRGEFVLMHAPPDLPILGFELTIRPPKVSPPNGGAPREFWLASSTQVYRVSLPEDGWRFPGARYEIALARPIRSDCLALITESSYGDDKNLRVSFAELSARTEFSSSSIEALVAALAGGGERSQAAGSVLRALGQPGFDATAAAFARLDEGGRRVALEILDSASCATSAPIYLVALRGPFPAQHIHGRDRLRRCGEKAADLLEQALKTTKSREATLLADELALLAPDRAIRALVPKLRSRNSALRRELRVVLARAMGSPRAGASVRELLRNASLDPAQTIDLLRALGPRAPRFQPESGQALGRLASPNADFRTRYLLLEPAAELDAQDAGARAFLRRALVLDPSPYVRAEAARRVRVPVEYRAELLRSVDDPELRVREAAITTLGERRGEFAQGSLLRRLEDDDWPLIRGAAAEALSSFGPDRTADRALGQALEDESPYVRAPVVRALGARRALGWAPVVRARLEDEKEAMIVRASAAASLGLMCDRNAVDLLVSYATKLSDPLLTGDLRVIAPIALASLSRIHPPDLAQRLARLLDPKAPPAARRAAQAAISTKGACQR